ncbi:Protein-disulfide isomerase (plasmid) [Rubrobacter radiotolerans]|uniref:Protein-disulfide isomerase n=1 Tax=Rubrobacter radiotolerans TaxID=42256 RepID=A0A023X8I1_RUBRA|nr:thioredoxin domain-containing protein [Rubrobacter radiotolerans]AHY48364.1 Protein-disulfide isomerase [Rubrobacter radiotolerans]MDX5895501.1 thioredoxin domain-containing protein [Rubrobacter radiotolerans]SMC01563.1 Protein-disulfide isomerase [Rubrobacter radiotolerans DSM 5868]
MENRQTEPTRNVRRTGGPQRTLLLFGGILLVALAAGAVIFLVPLRDGDGAQSNVPETTDAGPSELPAPTLGSEDAPVTMIEYSDFQCPYCGQFAREVKPELVEKYVTNGTLRIEWRDFPYLGQESVNAALAARAAQGQGKFWEYHDLLYGAQGSPGSGAFSDDGLVELAQRAGLDRERFESDFRSARYRAAVASAFEAGQRDGVRGTPTFVINGEQIVGAQPQPVFEEAIERAAREAEGRDG